MSQALRIHIAGAGALGLACAVRLAEAGAQVSVFDPSPPLANASGVAAGMLAPAFETVLDDAARPHLALLTAAREVWPGFAQRHGLALDRRGAMAVGDGERLGRLEADFAALGLAAERLGTAQAAALAPGLAAGFAGGIFTADDWRIDAGPAIRALRAAARDLGVAFRTEPLTGTADADRVVVATGAANSLLGLAPEIGRLQPIKGHILRLAGAPYAGVVVRGPAAYAAPAEGGMTVGATMEAGVCDDAIDPQRTAALRQAGEALFPGLAGATAEARVGVRAATADGLPLVGPSGSGPILLAAGARRNGWLLAPLVAEVVTAYALDAEPGPWAARMAPSRFT